MTKKRESGIQRRIRAALEREFPGSFWFKVHGGPFQAAGIPDLVGCVEGVFFGLEVKVPGKGKLSEIQKHTIKKIRGAGGWSQEITSPQEAVAAVNSFLFIQGKRLVAASDMGSTGRGAAAGGGVRRSAGKRRTPMRAGSRQDLDNRWSDRTTAKPVIHRAPRRFTVKPRDHMG